MALKMENRPLTSLRFLAAFYVFCFHMSRWPITEQWIVKAVLLHGAIGMSVFFVLSGFVMAMRYSDEMPSPQKYYVTRFARIYPVYFLVAALTLPWLAWDVAKFSGAPTWPFAVFQLVTNIFLLQAWFPEAFNVWNAGGSWSISAEAFFYALFPMVFPYAAKASARGLVFLGLSMWGLSSLVSLVYHAGISTSAFPVYYAIPAFRFPEFMFGVVIGLIFKRWGAAKRPSLWLILSIAILLLYIAIMGYSYPDLQYVAYHWLAVPAIGSIIYFAASLRAGPIFRVFGSNVLNYLGKISYSFYSMQLVLILSILKWHDALLERWPIFSNTRILWGTSFLALILASALCYHFIEEPGRRKILNRARRPPRHAKISAPLHASDNDGATQPSTNQQAA